MKRAKLFLVTISIFSVIGGIYAHKVQRIGDVIYIRTTHNTTLCYSTFSNATFDQFGASVTVTFATLQYGAVCTVLHTIYIGE
ncbi:hypothetical protein GO495_06655 [Chitinophaga oryziterrae]|uniref:Uncharacterized protein n=1 Tax=Chitinophaga oryziterrae TaxID=1031224 RepID=A0A6N8J4S7_9BACT|nr:hypothetical protein [Chitinophaga oryziterrae]MVT40255.1 hypothetical protein [Chitinophaga oryziterrae]